MNTTQFLSISNEGPISLAFSACDNRAAEYYQLPSRAYHTWEHVNHVYACGSTLLSHLLKSPDQLTDIESQAFVQAISWHDIFQGANHEVACAAKLYAEFPSVGSALAARIIIDGTTHFSEPDTGLVFKLLGIPVPTSDNSELLISAIHDADLMILGEQAANYDSYAHGIVVEALAFGLSPSDYRKRRTEFLSRVQIAAKDQTLFKTRPAQQLNPSVLENVERELRQIS